MNNLRKGHATITLLALFDRHPPGRFGHSRAPCHWRGWSPATTTDHRSRRPELPVAPDAADRGDGNLPGSHQDPELYCSQWYTGPHSATSARADTYLVRLS